ncbi:MAG: Ig-like domain-containing protein, partial [Verrucomicrobiales bacterium]|nr:Ig-like domain-containing protein [Verrucomicrobiales bacterium]
MRSPAINVATVAVFLFAALSSPAAPTTTPDSYTVPEDTRLNAGAEPLLDDNFNASAGITVAINTLWDYLDTLENNNGRGDSYPTDSSGRPWTDPDFDTSTSTLSPWLSASAPFAAGNINAFEGLSPSPLGGIAQPNTVTTYLFRSSFTLTAEQAATPSLSANLLSDDGAAVYANGIRVATVNLPDGPITSDTFAVDSGFTEDNYASIPLELEGVVRPGLNTIAVELHQGTENSSDAGFDLPSLQTASSSNNYTYVDDLFDTNRPNLADGELLPDGGPDGSGSLHVEIGRSNFFGRQTSAGWVNTFNSDSDASVTLTFSYRLNMSDAYEPEETGVILAVVDGQYLGADTFEVSGQQRNVITAISGPGDSGWQTATFDLQLTAGNHRLELGAYNNRASANNEFARAWFDDVSLRFSGGSASLGVIDNDTLAPGATAELVTSTTGGTLVFEPDGSFKYTPPLNFSGTDSFTYVATDDTGTSPETTATITVTPVNDPPDTTADAYSIDEDQPLSPLAFAALLSNDSDIEGNPFTARLDSPPTNGSATVNPDGTFSYTPTRNFFGSDTFTYIATDTEDSVPGVVTVTVAPKHDPPEPLDDTYTTLQNETLTLTLPTASEGGENFLTLIPEDAFWNYYDGADDQQNAWRQPGFDDTSWGNGQAELGYGDGDEQTEISFGGDGDNKFPTAYFRTTFEVSDLASITALSLAIKFDDGIAVYLNGTEIAREFLAADATYDTLSNAGFRDEDEVLTSSIDPALLVSGTNLIAAEVHQNSLDSSDISLLLSLSAEISAAYGVLGNDTDPDGDPLTATIATPPTNGSITLNPDGTFSYIPGLNHFGSDTFSYRADDGTEQVAATVTVNVTPGPNDIPEPVADTYPATEDTPLTISASQGVLSNDADPDSAPFPMVAKLVSPPSHGSVTLNPDGSFTYTPTGDYFGPDAFTYAAFDGLADSAETTVGITVSGTEDPPRGTADSYVVQPGQTLTIPVALGVLTNDSDPDGQPLAAQLAASSSSGSISLAPDGSFSYTPAAGFKGVDTFNYRVTDGNTPSTPLTVTLHINARPVATADSLSTLEDTPLTLPAPGLLSNDSDPENDSLTTTLASPPSNGTLQLSADGSLTYTPLDNFYGTDTFTYTVNDGLQDVGPVPVQLQVTAVNDPPDADRDDYTVDPDTTLGITAADGVLDNDSDLEDDTLTARLVAGVTNGTLSLSPDGAFTYTPNGGFIGEDSFTYIANDTQLDSDETTVTIGVQVDLDAIAINEVMFHPSSENDAEEFIEISNTGPFPINLEGWTFTSGITFTFPEVSIGPGGLLVLAADPETFTATYGPDITPLGPWIGSLSNRGERLRFKDDRGREADDITYFDQGEWATRVRTDIGGEDGWAWSAPQDGGGSSLEKISIAHSGEHGQNWAPSSGAPTPGLPNSVAAPDIAPVITGVRHSPAVPSSSDPVEIKCTLTDTPETATLNATLLWRVSSLSPGQFQPSVMDADGDGEFRTTLPPQADGTIIEFYVISSDGASTRSWPAATDEGQNANALYQVDDATHDSPGAGIYHLVMTAGDADTYLDNGFSQGSDALINTTVILDDGSGPVIRYNAGTRNRGKSSRSHNPIPMRVNLPRDTPWDGSTRMNLNPRYAHSQVIGMLLFQAAGLPTPDARRVKVRINGNDLARGDNFDYGFFAHVEPLSDEFLAAKIPGDPKGNLYKKEGGGGDDNWLYRDGDIDDYLDDEWSKRNNSSENDWSDLDHFLDIMVNSPGDLAQVETVADLDQWMRWFAAMNLMGNGETNLSNGRADDYTQYHGADDPRMILLPHDLDTILTMGDGFAINDPEHTLYDHIEDGDAHDQLEDLFDIPEVNNRYLEAVRELARTTFAKPSFDSLIRNHFTGWVPANVIDDIIDFMDRRRAFALAEAEDTLGPAPALTAPANDGTFSSPPSGPVFISEILADNNTAYDNASTFPDVIELHNRSASPAPVAGWRITDDPAVPDRYTIPAGTTIPPNGYLVIHATQPVGAPGLHTGFGLNNSGETLTLSDDSGAVVDSLTFGLQIPDLSISRTGPALDTWAITSPSPGIANQNPQNLGDPAGIRINEWLAQPEITYAEDFVELYNPSDSPVAIGSMLI